MIMEGQEGHDGQGGHNIKSSFLWIWGSKKSSLSSVASCSSAPWSTIFSRLMQKKISASFFLHFCTGQLTHSLLVYCDIFYGKQEANWIVFQLDSSQSPSWLENVFAQSFLNDGGVLVTFKTQEPLPTKSTFNDRKKQPVPHSWLLSTACLFQSSWCWLIISTVQKSTLCIICATCVHVFTTRRQKGYNDTY